MAPRELDLVQRTVTLHLPPNEALSETVHRFNGTEILLKRFGAGHVYAFDLDPAMVEQARRRLSRYRSIA